MSKIILGGGISGLSTAFYLSKRCNNGLLVYEATDRLGGWIKTRETARGTYFEQGARTLRSGNAAAENCLEMIEEIGLSSAVRPVPQSFSKRYFYVNNELQHFPLSWTALFKKDNVFNEPMLYPLMRDVFGGSTKLNDESVYDFFSRRFGKGCADILSAIICGIFAGSASEISIKAAMKSAFENEQRYGSVVLGFLLDSYWKRKQKAKGSEKKVSNRPTRAWSFAKGMESLPKALGEYLITNRKADIQLRKKCNRIDFCDDGVRLDINGKTEHAEYLYSSLPSNELSRLLGREHAFLKDELSKIPFVSVAVVNLEYDGNVLPVDGFGLLIPPNQNLPILGIIFDSCIYPKTGKTVLTVMMGGRWFKHYLGVNPEKEFILKIATDHVKKILNVHEKPIGHIVSILQDCIPQYLVGHEDLVNRINSYITEKKLPLKLVGNSYNGVGIPDSILSARLAVGSH